MERILHYSLFDRNAREMQQTGSFKISFTGVTVTVDLDNYTSTLFVTNVGKNETNLTCRGAIYDRRDLLEATSDTVSICLVGEQCG